MTQDILSDMDSDEVNSINDTVESLQVATIIRSTFENIITGRGYPHKDELLKLENSGDTDKPTYMRLPESVTSIKSVRYNKKLSTDTRDKYDKVTYLLPDDFLDIVNARISDADNVETIEDFSGVSIYVLNDVAPTYYTSFDDEWLVFDSYDADANTTLVSTKTQCFGTRLPTFTLADDFTPDLPIQMFPYLLNEAKSTCFAVLKQMPNQKAEQHSISQRRRMSQEAWRIKNGITRPDYGRRSKKRS